jgi:polysaccharide biosynthesis/export protein
MADAAVELTPNRRLKTPSEGALKSLRVQYNHDLVSVAGGFGLRNRVYTNGLLGRVLRRALPALSCLLLLCATLASELLRAQTPSLTPTPEQLDLFRNLPADQQQALMQQLGGLLGQGSGSLALPGALGSSRQGQLGREGQGDQSTLDQLNGMNRSGEPPEPLIPVLKPEDWIIVEVDFHLAARPAAAGVAAPAESAPGSTGADSQQQSLQTPLRSESEPTEEETARQKKLITLIRSRNPYQLSREGVLFLPGFTGIPLAGLIEDLATLRLKVEPALSNLDIRVTRLPLKKTGAEGLKPFGYDLFLKSPSTFAPVTNVPVPSDYILGPGDQLEVQLYGTQNRMLRLQVGRDGIVSFPELGPINVGGERFTQAQALIESRVAREMIGVRASVSMGDTRSIRVFVLGDANRPGSYTISGLGTITSALYAAGGVKPIGSLRKIELKRQGTLVRRLDLYNLLIRGDTTDDTKLLPGDVIFIPPVGPTVSVDGEVRRPAIYEETAAATVADVLQLAGGLTAEADTAKVVLTRIDAARGRVVMQVDLAGQADKTQLVRDGDLLRVARMRPTLDSGVLVRGHVFAPGAVAYRPGMRLTDVIHSVDELQPNADIHYLLIRRELPPDRRVSVLSADLAGALRAPGSAADVPLMPRDQITVFDLQSGRDRIIQPILEDLRLQSNLARPTQVVRVDGRVKVPGEYPLEPGMKVSDLIRAGGSLQDAAYAGSAELIRYDVVDGERRSTQLISIDLQALLRGDSRADIPLEPFDLLNIKEMPQWGAQESVELRGEIRFPGRYVLKRGETLKSLIIRAGGLTDYAFPYGAVFTREELRKREQEQIDELAERLKHDLAILALQSVAISQGQGGGAALTVGQALLSQLKGAKAVGRLVIDLPRALNSPVGSSADVILRGGDRLIVPKFQQEITVLGEVQNSTSHLYRAGMTRDDYIALSGGATRRADTSRIYVVHANGSVVANEGNRWFQRTDNSIRPGDTVVVPLNAEHLPPLPFWQAVTSILYNVAIAAAAVHSF